MKYNKVIHSKHAAESHSSGLRQRKKELGRLSILEVASRLVAEGGTEALSLRKVAEEVGASTMVVYTAFGSKEGLLEALWVEGFRRLWELEEDALQNPDPLLRLRALGQAYRRNALSNPYFYKLVFGGQLGQAGPIRANSEALAGRQSNNPDRSLRTFEVLIETVAACQRANQITPSIPAADIAAMLWSTGHGMVSLELAGMLSPKLNPNDFFEQTFDYLLTGLR